MITTFEIDQPWGHVDICDMCLSYLKSYWLLTLVQGQDVWMVFLRESDDGLPTEGPESFLVHSLSGDGGGGGAGPVQCVPGLVVGQALNWTHI